MEPFVLPIQFHPSRIFDKNIHRTDVVAKKYLEKAIGTTHNLVPVDVDADGNCLYHSIRIFMNNSTITTSELRSM